MANRTVLIFGSTGMLGTALVWQFHSFGYRILAPTSAEFNVATQSLEAFNWQNVDCVVNASGIINRRVNAGASNQLVEAVNAEFPHRLASTCENYKVPCIHISTDCVFSGEHGPYFENTASIPHDVYGASKKAGEPNNCLVIRSSIVGPEYCNFYSLLCWFLAQTGKISGFKNHYWSGVSSLELARLCHTIFDQDLYEPRIQHVFGEDISKYELLSLFKGIFETGHEIQAIDAPTPRDTRLRTQWPEFVEALQVKPLRQQIEDLRPLCDEKGHWHRHLFPKTEAINTVFQEAVAV
jgi:dTDP-4-dehydrorhamnose reductase